MENNIEFVKAEKKDIDDIISFIEGIAIYEKMEDQITLDKEDLKNELFKKEAAYVYFIKLDSKKVGYIVYFYNFSTFKGHRGLYVEDIYILPEYRHLGLGRKAFSFLAQIALDNGCERMEWVCLNWNAPSIKFYKSMNAKSMDEWIIFRLVKDDIEKLKDNKIE